MSHPQNPTDQKLNNPETKHLPPHHNPPTPHPKTTSPPPPPQTKKVAHKPHPPHKPPHSQTFPPGSLAFVEDGALAKTFHPPRSNVNFSVFRFSPSHITFVFRSSFLALRRHGGLLCGPHQCGFLALCARDQLTAVGALSLTFFFQVAFRWRTYINEFWTPCSRCLLTCGRKSFLTMPEYVGPPIRTFTC